MQSQKAYLSYTQNVLEAQVVLKVHVVLFRRFFGKLCTKPEALASKLSHGIRLHLLGSLN